MSPGLLMPWPNYRNAAMLVGMAAMTGYPLSVVTVSRSGCQQGWFLLRAAEKGAILGLSP